MSKARKRLIRTWHQLSPWLAAALTLIALAGSLAWCSRALYLPYGVLAVVSVLVGVLWFLVLWPILTEFKLVLVASIGGGVVTLLLTAGLGWLLVDRARGNYLESSGLNSRRAEYAQAREFKNAAGQVKPGKAVVLEQTESGKFDFGPLQFDLPRQALPNTEADVELVFLVSWKEMRAGQYSNGAVAYGWRADVQCVDWRAKTVLQRTEFVKDPPKRTNNSVYATNGMPTDEVRAWMRKFLR